MCENFLETYAEELYFSCYLQQVPQTMKKVLQVPSFSPLHQSTCVSFLCSFLTFTMQIYSININVDSTSEAPSLFNFILHDTWLKMRFLT